MSDSNPTIRIGFGRGEHYATCPVCPSHIIRRHLVRTLKRAMASHGKQHGWKKITWTGID